MIMKREGILCLFFSVIFIIGCVTPESNNLQDVPEVITEKITGEVPSTKPITEESKKTEEQPKIAAAKVIQKEKFDLIFPTLTYEGAYNGPLYGTSEQVGAVSMDTYFNLLDRNGINYFIGMFPVAGEPSADALLSNEGLGAIIDAVQKHPYRVIPFFSPGIGGKEVEKSLGPTLTGRYTQTLSASQNIVGKSFIKGFGEIETQEWSVRHNDPKVLQLISLAEQNNINVMFHPVASKADDVGKIIEAYPNTIFLIHLYREDLANGKDKWIKLLKEHDNLYFSMDAAHIIHVNNMDIIYDYDSSDTQASIKKLVSEYDSKEKSIINDAINAYKPLVDAAPDKVMWGTEIGPKYAFDPQVFDRAVRASRFVIAGFNPEHQEAVGYRNALRVFGEGSVVDPSIKVINTQTWKECSDSEMNTCDETCETPNEDSLTVEEEACFKDCLIKKQCREVVEMDVG